MSDPATVTGARKGAKDESTKHPVHAVTVAELAALLDVSPRRVRQMRENGEIITAGRGRLDVTHAVNAVLGRRYLGVNRRPATTWQAAGVGWLLGHRGITIGPDELEPWFAAAARWGLTRTQATAELLNAAALMGERAPQFQE